jgi:hypothetical protein
MADTNTPDAPPNDGGGKKGKGGIKAFIKKNKTLSAIAGVGGLYFLWKMKHESPGEPTTAIGEGGEASAAEGLGGTAELAAYEVGRAERAQERTAEDLTELEDENRARLEKEKGKREEAEEEKEKPSKEPEPGPEKENPAPSSNGISIHGKTFLGATKSHISKSGKTEGGKKYVEYAISFPGRVEHWQYFTDTGNWRQVNNSAGGAAGNNGQGSKGNGSTGGTSGKQTGGGVGKAKPVSKPKIGVSSGKALPSGGGTHPTSPTVAAAHPQAVNTGNRCVNGGVGPHTAPPGYHLFCSGGFIYRAPN